MAAAPARMSEENRQLALYVANGGRRLTQYIYHFDSNDFSDPTGRESSPRYPRMTANSAPVTSSELDPPTPPYRRLGIPRRFRCDSHPVRQRISIGSPNPLCHAGPFLALELFRRLRKGPRQAREPSDGAPGSCPSWSLRPPDGRVYVLLDGGDGPEIGEWEVTAFGTGGPWKAVGRIPVK